MPKIADMNRDAGVGDGEKAEGGGGAISGPNAEIIKVRCVEWGGRVAAMHHTACPQ